MRKFLITQAKANIEIASDYLQENADKLALQGECIKDTADYQATLFKSQFHLLVANFFLMWIGESVESINKN